MLSPQSQKRNDKQGYDFDEEVSNLKILQNIQYGCLRCYDWIQTKDAQRKIRIFAIPILIVGSIMMLVTGATWAKLLTPQCGTNLDSARFTIGTDEDTGERIIEGNSCPGYDWTKERSPIAGEFWFTYHVSTAPRISKSPIYVDASNPLNGPIGVTLNGIPIYAPSTSKNGNAVSDEIGDLDKCGGRVQPSPKFSFDAPIPGFYYYRQIPGVVNSARLASQGSLSSKLLFCGQSKTWYNESIGVHSPLAGFMADGVPIYGPYGNKGKVPTDLDSCGGHSSDKKFYHYHFQLKYPYSVRCLKGCADGSMNTQISSGRCAVNNSKVYDFTSLASLKIRYGGEGVNDTNWTGPACLLAFGFLIFIPSLILGFCMCCAGNVTKMHDRPNAIPLARLEEFGNDDDNIL